MRNSLKTLIGKKDLIGAEIGVAKGINAKDILLNLDIQKLYLIDPYKMYTKVRVKGIPRNVKGLKQKAYTLLEIFEDKIVWIHEMSDVAYKQIKEKLDFVYIDANHTYDFVKSDLTIYRDMVKDNGLVAGHDYGDKVKKAVDELVSKDKLKVEKSDWWYIK